MVAPPKQSTSLCRGGGARILIKIWEPEVSFQDLTFLKMKIFASKQGIGSYFVISVRFFFNIFAYYIINLKKKILSPP